VTLSDVLLVFMIALVIVSLLALLAGDYDLRRSNRELQRKLDELEDREAAGEQISSEHVRAVLAMRSRGTHKDLVQRLGRFVRRNSQSAET
jgi:hypothetical protein